MLFMRIKSSCIDTLAIVIASKVLLPFLTAWWACFALLRFLPHVRHDR
jgi:hypothetical protein